VADPAAAAVSPRARLAGPALTVAPRLLGARIASMVGGARVVVRLTEVEAYAGAQDPASHAFRGRTARNAVMFGPPGHLYCYFTYGMHWCANVVCGTEGVATAVLLRAGEVVDGVSTARSRRPAARGLPELARGPARLAACLGLDRVTNGVDLCDPASPVVLTGVRGRRPVGVCSGPRVGVAAAPERPWRFWLAAESTVSAYRPGGRPRRAARSPAPPGTLVP
jgi:DNA-3-methyladenine glycosylase